MSKKQKKHIVKVSVTVNWDMDDKYPVTDEEEAKKIFFEQARDFGEWEYEWSD